ncbi:probable WRKY transcription factor 32 [Andrographis paniculata]|uniref:probable WRKY transcription factor 32 n=1 Tax=Andrographis paniculata TaxID=175694 RepID=UPI0021E860C2|nr:probable WRKY transcription factor 32 [Andrographis paniculata]
MLKERRESSKLSFFVSGEKFAVAEESNRSSLGGMEEGDSKPAVEEGGGGAELGENEAQRLGSEGNSSDCAAEKTSSGERGELLLPQSETLGAVRISESGLQSYKESSENLSEVPVEYSLQPLQSVGELKVKTSFNAPTLLRDAAIEVNNEAVKGIDNQATNLHTQKQVQIPERPPKLAVLPKSTKQSVSPIPTPSPSTSKKELHPLDSGNSHLTVQGKQNSPDSKPSTGVTMLKTFDGYNWRKYGQKQVKSPEGSRSYYRCTFSNCHAKKIECCDCSSRVVETIYRSQHNHDPPQKVNCTRENRSPRAVFPVNGSHETTHTRRGLSDSIPSTSPKESLVVSDQIPEPKQQDSCGSDETMEINVKEEYVEGPEYKRREVLRQKRIAIDESDSTPKTGKKPKYVVHAAGDVGISGDGYRWRKYGQKMVKGNPHPRNYYRCTSAGCPVRKQIERDVDNDSAVVITYKGAHNHDVPVPRKRYGPKNTPTITEEDIQSKTEPQEGELTGETLKLGGEKSSESARTLLSIGFEIKPC